MKQAGIKKLEREKKILGAKIMAALKTFTDRTGIVALQVEFDAATESDGNGDLMVVQYYNIRVSARLHV